MSNAKGYKSTQNSRLRVVKELTEEQLTEFLEFYDAWKRGDFPDIRYFKDVIRLSNETFKKNIIEKSYSTFIEQRKQLGYK